MHHGRCQVVEVDERVGDLLRDAHALLPHENRLLSTSSSSTTTTSSSCCRRWYWLSQPAVERAAQTELEHEALRRPVGGESEKPADIFVGDADE